jgi:hypothetical protein
MSLQTPLPALLLRSWSCIHPDPARARTRFHPSPLLHASSLSCQAPAHFCRRRASTIPHRWHRLIEMPSAACACPSSCTAAQTQPLAAALTADTNGQPPRAPQRMYCLIRLLSSPKEKSLLPAGRDNGNHELVYDVVAAQPAASQPAANRTTHPIPPAGRSQFLCCLNLLCHHTCLFYI